MFSVIHHNQIFAKEGLNPKDITDDDPKGKRYHAEGWQKMLWEVNYDTHCRVIQKTFQIVRISNISSVRHLLLKINRRSSV